MTDPIVITGYARTPIGAFQGSLAKLPATALGAAAIRSAVERSAIAPADVEQAIMGCVLAAGLGQAPARQAALGAGLALAGHATTINKMCGSGMQALIMAHDMIAAGSAGIVVAGGMENMTNAPYLLGSHRGGRRFGHDRLIDSMMCDGLEDAYQTGVAMGRFADDAARATAIGREPQDDYALETLERARRAQDDGSFAREIAAVRVGAEQVDRDEQPLRATPHKVRLLKPSFADDGTITPASSSSISDGAAALLLMRQSAAIERGAPVAARVAGHAAVGDEPATFAALPGRAITALLAKVGWSLQSVDLFEINEAFAVVPLIAMQQLGIDRDRLNIRGGACALGHPIGASGARIVVTLLAAMEDRNAKRGVAAICLGGGEAIALAVERAL